MGVINKVVINVRMFCSRLALDPVLGRMLDDWFMCISAFVL